MLKLVLVPLEMGSSQGCALALRERVVVVRGNISMLCKAYLLENVFPRSQGWMDAYSCTCPVGDGGCGTSQDKLDKSGQAGQVGTSAGQVGQVWDRLDRFMSGDKPRPYK